MNIKEKIAKSKKKIILTVLLCILCVAAGLIISRPLIKKHSEKKVEAYQDRLNEDGIAIDTENNPYFMEKQPGYDYRSPKTITYESKVTGTKRKAMVFLPADYDEEKEYPVLYLLHGYGGSQKTWRNKNADIIVQNVHYFKDAAEMIVVCPDCVVGENVDDDISFWDVIPYFDKTEEELIGSLMPYIEEHFSVKTGRDNTAIAGNSMGGRNALAIGFKHQDMFGYVGGFSSVSPLYTEKYQNSIPALTDSLTINESTGQFKLLMLCVGRSDNVCGDVTYELHDYFNQNDVEHIFYDVDGGHQNTVWQNALYNFTQRIFR